MDYVLSQISYILVGIVSIAPIIAIIVAYFMSISLIIDAIQSKGHRLEKTGTLWFVGLFATPIILSLYAVSLPKLDPPELTAAQQLRSDMPQI